MKEADVVLVDDDRSLRESVQRALRREPYRVVVVPSARECLEVVCAAPIRVVVCDQRMPGIQGLDLLSHLRATRPEIVRIVLSGNVSLSTAFDAINECEVFRLLSKPCPSAELALAIRAALEHHHLTTSTQRLLELIQLQSDMIRRCFGATHGTSSAVPRAERNFNLPSLIKCATGAVEDIERFMRTRSN